MPEVELSAGPIEYEDTGGDGPVLVFLHGLTIDSSVWRNVVVGLRDQYRCVLPTLPLGAHRRPMRPDAGDGVAGRGVPRRAGPDRRDARAQRLGRRANPDPGRKNGPDRAGGAG